MEAISSNTLEAAYPSMGAGKWIDLLSGKACRIRLAYTSPVLTFCCPSLGFWLLSQSLDAPSRQYKYALAFYFLNLVNDLMLIEARSGFCGARDEVVHECLI